MYNYIYDEFNSRVYPYTFLQILGGGWKSIPNKEIALHMHMNAFYGNWLSHREFHKNFKQPPHKSAESLFKQMIQATEIIAFKDFSRNQNLSFYV